MRLLTLSVPVQTELYLLDLDKRKLRNYCREHDFANMAKRKKNEHDKIRMHLKMVQKDQARNATYTSMTGCNTAEKSNDDSRKSRGGEGGGEGRGGAGAVNMCKYKEYGCGGKLKHKTNRSKHCDFSGIEHSIIGTYFLLLN